MTDRLLSTASYPNGLKVDFYERGSAFVVDINGERLKKKDGSEWVFEDLGLAWAVVRDRTQA